MIGLADWGEISFSGERLWLNGVEVWLSGEGFDLLGGSLTEWGDVGLSGEWFG